ncbi:MAG: PAS domain S-box protein [Deltaproteobacteria bacterium]|nr:PAS domain S-box protein [Deltaproteobacteria bacterium]
MNKIKCISLNVFGLLLCGVIFWVDAFTLISAASGMPYVVAILISICTPQIRCIISLATLCSLLTILGYFLSPEIVELWDASAHRFLTLCVIWVTTGIVVGYKRIEENLKEAKKTYQSMFLNSQAGLSRTKLTDGKFLEINDRLVEMFGYDDTEDFKANYSAIKCYADEGERERLMGLLKMSGTVDNFTTRALRKDGSVFWIQLCARVNQEQGFIDVVSLDIDELKLAEDKLFKNKEKLLRLNEDLHQLISETARIEDKERKQYSEILHDVIGQNLVLIKMNLESGLEECCPHEIEGHAAISKAFLLLQDTIEKTRSITTELYPSILDNNGLVSALEWYKQNVLETMGISVNLDLDETVEELTQRSKRTIYRLIKECLQNIIKHAEASNVFVTCHPDSGMFKLSITDDGVGFDEKETDTKHGLGLLMMREQAVSLDAEFNIHSQTGKGTAVSVTIPFQQ